MYDHVQANLVGLWARVRVVDHRLCRKPQQTGAEGCLVALQGRGSGLEAIDLH